MDEKEELGAPPKPLSLFRLVVDQARVTPEVRNYTYAGSGTDDDPYVVVWIPDDPGNPFTWRKSLRWAISMLVAIETLSTAFASSAFSGTSGRVHCHDMIETDRC